MPRPSFPPTPQPSTDITGKSSANAPQLEGGFTLPPAALNGRGSVASSSGPSDAASDSSYRPPSPASPVATTKTTQSRKRSSPTSQQGVVTKDDYSLPPPPTRSRKIIQMKPKDTQEATTAQPEKPDSKAPAEKGKRKQAGNTTAAGRKIARKTAHSLIERRRRSKMNEEFGVLKDMIPACRDQEMHKLAILQVRTCVKSLKVTLLTDRRLRLSTCATSSNVLPTSRQPIKRDTIRHQQLLLISPHHHFGANWTKTRRMRRMMTTKRCRTWYRQLTCPLPFQSPLITLLQRHLLYTPLIGTACTRTPILPLLRCILRTGTPTPHILPQLCNPRIPIAIH